MKLLLDECIAIGVRNLFPDDEVHSARWAGLRNLVNGTLLAAAVERKYEVLITIDKNLRHQNKVSKFAIAVIVVIVKNSRIGAFREKVEQIRAALKRIKPGEVIVVE